MVNLPRALRSARHQAGFTLVEVMIALVVGALILAAAATAMITMLRSNAQSERGLASSNSAFATGSRFGDDVASVGPVAGATDLVSTGTTGCGGSTALLRLVGPGTTGVRVWSYHRVTTADDTELIRRTCEGATLGAATAATPTALPVVLDLNPASGSITVGCDGGAVSSACQVVEMSVQTRSNRSFTVRGAIASSLAPTPTTAPTPVIAPTVGTCTLDATATAWVGTGSYAGDANTNHGSEAELYTYNQAGPTQRRSYLKFDLTGPCRAGSDWPTLPGGRKVTGATLKLHYVGRSNSLCIVRGFSYTEQSLKPLAETSTWSQSTVTGANGPTATRSGYDAIFDAPGANPEFTWGTTASAGTVSLSPSAILDTVRGWYAAGGWTNNGWLLSRNTGGDTCGVSVTFASMNAPDVNQRPQLVVTWGPP